MEPDSEMRLLPYDRKIFQQCETPCAGEQWRLLQDMGR